MKVSKNSAIFIGFGMWFFAGVMLLYKGMNYLYEAQLMQSYSRTEQPVLGFLSHLFGSVDYALLSVVLVSALFGYIKGYVALRKAADRLIRRIAPYGGKVPLPVAFPVWYVGIIFGMMMLGFVIKFLPISTDVRGMLDTAIGFALLNGSTFFLKYLIVKKRAA